MTLTSTVTDNGHLNPYAVVVAPVGAGRIRKDDVLVDNSNLQGTGTTIVIHPPLDQADAAVRQAAAEPAAAPGGVGLTTSMTMLKTGWVIVGSTPSRDGTTATKGDGAQATLFISMAGEGPPSPDVLDPKTKLPGGREDGERAAHPARRPRRPAAQDRGPDVVGDGFSQRADRDNFLPGSGPRSRHLSRRSLWAVRAGLGDARRGTVWRPEWSQTFCDPAARLIMRRDALSACFDLSRPPNPFSFAGRAASIHGGLEPPLRPARRNSAKEFLMALGTVKWFNATKGYGFIAPEEGSPDVFVHVSAVERAGLTGLMDGQKVSYELEQDRKSGKMSATALSVVG